MRTLGWWKQIWLPPFLLRQPQGFPVSSTWAAGVQNAGERHRENAKLRSGKWETPGRIFHIYSKPQKDLKRLGRGNLDIWSQVVSSINHPSICSIFKSNRHMALLKVISGHDATGKCTRIGANHLAQWVSSFRSHSVRGFFQYHVWGRRLSDNELPEKLNTLSN